MPSLLYPTPQTPQRGQKVVLGGGDPQKLERPPVSYIYPIRHLKGFHLVGPEPCHCQNSLRNLENSVFPPFPLLFSFSLSLSLSLSHTTFFLAALFLSRCFHSLPLLPFSPAPSFLSRSFFPLFFFCIHSSCTAFSFPLGGGRYTVDRGLLRKLSKTPSPTGVVWGRKPDGGKLQCKPSPGKWVEAHE